MRIACGNVQFWPEDRYNFSYFTADEYMSISMLLTLLGHSSFLGPRKALPRSSNNGSADCGGV